MKSSIGILMGIVILAADVAWLYVGGNYTYTPWLVLGIVIFIASLILVDRGLFANERGSESPESVEKTEDPSMKKSACFEIQIISQTLESYD